MMLSPTNIHDPIECFIGDTLTIFHDCKNPDGSLMTLDGTTFTWGLIAGDGTIYYATVSLTDTDGANGKVKGEWSSSVTELLEAGYYTDHLRTVKSGQTYTQTVGRIEMKETPL